MVNKTQKESSQLIFLVGPYCFSVSAMEVEAIIRPPPTFGLPPKLAPEFIAGTIVYRDEIACVVDLHHKFGIPANPDTTSGQLILTRLDTGFTAFRVDNVLDLASADALEWHTPETIGPENGVRQFIIQDDAIILQTTFELLYRMPTARKQAVSPAAPPLHPWAAIEDDGHPAGRPDPEAPDSLLNTGEDEQRVEPTEQSDPVSQSLSAGDDDPFLADYQEQVAHTKATFFKHKKPLPSPPAETWVKASIPKGGARNQSHPDKRISSPHYHRGQRRPAGHGAGNDRLPVFIAGIVLLLCLLLAVWLWQPIEQNVYEAPLAEAVVPEATEPPFTARPEPAAGAEIVPPDPTPDSSEEILRVETDQFTLTIERPQKDQLHEAGSQIIPQQENESIHVVVKGDTLWHIASRYLGDPFQYNELAQLSRIRDPDLIYPGDIIRIIKKNGGSGKS